MTRPLVSIIIPTYNYAHFVVDAVESALAQTYPDREIIVVDDGSRDDTKIRLQPYFGQITYIFQENRGLSAARNAGIHAARGELIALLDSDDIWHPRKLEIQVAHLAANPTIGLVASAHRDFSGAVPSPEELPPILAERIRFEDLVRRSRFGPSGVVTRRDCFDRAGMFDESLRSSEDRDMWIRIARRHTIDLLNVPLWFYRAHETSMSRNAIRMEENEARVLRKAFAEGCPARLRRIALSHALYSSSYMFKESRAYGKALRRLLRSIRLWPLPYARSDVKTGLARPKLLTMILLRIVQSAIGTDPAERSRA